MRKLYYIDMSGGGALPEEPKPPIAPKGYTVTTPQQRTEWNSFLDYLDKQGVAGKADLDRPGAGLTYFKQYKKANPTFSLTPEQIRNIQYEQYQLRKGEQFGSLNKMQLEHIRQGLAQAYLSRPVSDVTGEINAATSRLYYPSGKAYGTDIEHYDNALLPPNVNAAKEAPMVTLPGTIAASKPASVAAPPAPVDGIPRPNYTDQQSRLNYAKAWSKKYGPLMQGRGDTPLRVNDVPQYATQTSKQMSESAASKLGIDPALLYSSAMEEGLSGNFADLEGNYQYERSGQSDQFPINSSADFGLDQVRSEIKRYQAKGYLPKDFQRHYVNAKHTLGELGSGNKPVTQNDVDLDSPESAMLLKAAYLKDNYDSTEKYAEQNKISLSSKAKDFFSLIAYNAGEGNMKKMMKEYADAGYLKDDRFLDRRPSVGWKIPYENVIRRIKMAEALKKEKLFD